MKAMQHIPGAILIWVASYVFFLFSLADNFSASHDSMHYLLGIIKGDPLFHPHHLLYHFFAHQWLAFFSSFLPAVPEPYLVEAFTAFWGSSVLAIIYSFFRRRFYLARAPAFAAVAVIGFSYGLWLYSVNIEVYMPPLFFILVCLFIVTRKNFSAPDVWKVAVLHSLAILFHQVNILFAVVVLYVLFSNKKRLRVPQALTRYILIGIVVTGSVYFYAGWISEGKDSLVEWVRWMEGYTVGHGYWQPLTEKTPLSVLTGLSRAFIGGHYIFQLPPVGDFLRRVFPAHSLSDELFLGSDMSQATVWLLAALSLLFAAVFLTLLVRFLLRFNTILARSEPVKPLLVCLLTYSLFFCFWMPEILEFWILQMVIIWLLLIGTLPLTRFPLGISLRSGLWLTAALVFVLNFFGSMRWLRDIRYDWYYREVEKVRGQLGPGDLVIVEDGWIIKDYFRYYTLAAVLASDEPGYSREEVQRKAREVFAARGKVYVYRQPDERGRFIQF